MSFIWTGEIIGEVATYLKQGLSAAQIGAQLGISRNAVIGKVGREKALSKIGFAWTRAKPFAGKHPERLKAIKLKKRCAKPERIVVPVVETLPFHVAGKPMLMLQARECKWPVNDAEVGQDHLFCSSPTDSGHYCTHHRSKLYVRRAAA